MFSPEPLPSLASINLQEGTEPHTLRYENGRQVRALAPKETYHHLRPPRYSGLPTSAVAHCNRVNAHPLCDDPSSEPGRWVEYMSPIQEGERVPAIQYVRGKLVQVEQGVYQGMTHKRGNWTIRTPFIRQMARLQCQHDGKHDSFVGSPAQQVNGRHYSATRAAVRAGLSVILHPLEYFLPSQRPSTETEERVSVPGDMESSELDLTRHHLHNPNQLQPSQIR